MFEADHIFAGFDGVEGCGFAFDVFLAVVGSFEGETDATFGLIDLDDAGFDFLTDFQMVLDLVDAIFADLGDMDEAVDITVHGDEGTESGDFGDLAFDEIADFVFVFDFLPRIAFELFHTEADALVLLVDIDDDRFEFVALFDHFGRVIDLSGPRHIGDMDHAIDAFFEFDERTVSGEVADRALDLATELVAVFDFVPRIGLELANAEADFLLFLVDAEDDGFDILADSEDVGWARDALGPGEFGDMDETFDAFFDLDEGTVGDQIGDFAFDASADGEAVFGFFPRIFLGLFEAEGDAFFVAIDVENLDIDFLSDLDHFAGVAEAAPAHIGDVEETVHAIEIDEGAEVGEVFDHALDRAADFDGIEEALAFFAAFLLDEFAAGKDDIFAIVINFDDFEVVGIADELLEILGWDDIDLGAWKEGFDADIDDESAFDDGFDLAFDEAVAVEDGDNFFPILAIGGLFFGENDGAFVVFEATEKDFDFVTDLEVIDVIEFAEGDNAF